MIKQCKKRLNHMQTSFEASELCNIVSKPTKFVFTKFVDQKIREN